MKPARLGSVVIVDDDSFVRKSLESALAQSGFEIVGSFSTAHETLELCGEQSCDVALLDLDLGLGPTGFDLAHALRKINSQIGIIFLTSYQDPRFAAIGGLSAPRGSR